MRKALLGTAVALVIAGVHPVTMTDPAQGASCRSDYDLCPAFCARCPSTRAGGARRGDDSSGPGPYGLRMPERMSLGRREAQDPPRATVGREPERAVRPLAHVADALA